MSSILRGEVPKRKDKSEARDGFEARSIGLQSWDHFFKMPLAPCGCRIVVYYVSLPS
ncbi:MAG: hypothetical protein UW70_C0023G0002 [Candidatus Peregrinibacteria bacterium GW2011_GWA2_44_7]|nr:MAG: hypothetical protein UW70_C0023G0002 [Candidatus Peregrinibacteria bacterium GW2011_GWA2_44_7]